MNSNKLTVFILWTFIIGCNNQHKTFYETGEIKEIITKADGVKEGPYFKYYKSGQLEVIANNHEDQLEGSYKEYWQNGNLALELVYQNGLPNGPASYYHENGNLMKQGDLQKGEKLGVWKAYRENGTPQSYVDFTLDRDNTYKNQIIHFTEKGDTVREGSQYFSVWLDKDTVNPYEMTTLKVKLQSGYFSDSGQISVNFITTDSLLDNMFIREYSKFRSKGDSENVAFYSVERAEPGLYHIQGCISEYFVPDPPPPMDYQMPSRLYFFRKDFYVKESKE